ncbi:hypothetical protein [Pseudaminobacter soli (ex Li et al. 2025)]|uniref:hypothetical protein n=1 Tax=Pseudaminobacter soli (ex Li et al. 2025) TaxID=1295366 RepID=UPI001FE0E6A7|nr:hypothetical protein [Mesorhizobium soli]
MSNVLAALLAAAVLTGAAQASECPGAATADDGFVLERPGIRSVYKNSDDDMVMQVSNSFDSGPPQTQFFLGGLIELFRTSKTGQFAILPYSDMRGIFPLKAGAQRKLDFVELLPGEETAEPVVLELKVTGKEKFSLGRCSYDVLAVKLVKKKSDGEELDAWTALYAPDLQAVLAKRYDEGTAQETTVGYAAIKPLSE